MMNHTEQVLTNTHRRLLKEELSMPPESANRTHSASYVTEENFDTNMVIILAALLCSLVFALGLNTILRCCMRCSRWFSMETQEQQARRLAATGLKKRDLRQLPETIYGCTESSKVLGTECPICLGEFVKGDKVRVLPKCHHGFHVRCIDTWLVSHSSCPNCRISLLECVNTNRSSSEQQHVDGTGQQQQQQQQQQRQQQQSGEVILVVDEIGS